MSDFLENQKKKKEEENEASPTSPQASEASAESGAEEDEVVVEAASLHEDPDTEELEGELEEGEEQKVKAIHAALEKEHEEVARLAKTNEELQKEVKVLEERVEELENAGNVSEGWMGPHEANKLREENQMYKIKVQNQNREIQRLRNQIRVGHR